MSRRDPQPGDLEGLLERHRRHTIPSRLRKDYPEATRSLSDSDLQALVERGYDNALELEITTHEDIYRFISLQLLPKDFLHSPFIQSVLIRVLNNLGLSGEQRMRFIEQQVVRRLKGWPILPR